ATFTEIVATARVKRARTTTRGLVKWPVRVTGSQMALPYTTTVAEVIRTAISGKAVIVVGRPRTWPRICWRWLAPNRVKSGMLSDSVDQKAIMAVREGKKSV